MFGSKRGTHKSRRITVNLEAGRERGGGKGGRPSSLIRPLFGRARVSFPLTSPDEATNEAATVSSLRITPYTRAPPYTHPVPPEAEDFARPLSRREKRKILLHASPPPPRGTMRRRGRCCTAFVPRSSVLVRRPPPPPPPFHCAHCVVARNVCACTGFLFVGAWCGTAMVVATRGVARFGMVWYGGTR